MTAVGHSHERVTLAARRSDGSSAETTRKGDISGRDCMSGRHFAGGGIPETNNLKTSSLYRHADTQSL